MKHVVLSGLSRGLGRAAVLRFAADGWIVSGCGTDAAALESLARELGEVHLTRVCDVKDSDAVAAFPASGALSVSLLRSPKNFRQASRSRTKSRRDRHADAALLLRLTRRLLPKSHRMGKNRRAIFGVVA